MTRWFVIPEVAAVFPDLVTTASMTGEEVNASWMSRLMRIEQAGAVYYVKVYVNRGRGMRQVLGRSRVRAEWENLALLGAMGIPTAEVVACGEEQRNGRYTGVLVTREVRGTRDLATLVTERHPLLADMNWRRSVAHRLSDAVHTMHLNRFVHSDLKWRNILVETTAEPAVYIIDCPLGRKLIGPFLDRGIIKDLACLDKVAKQVLSRTDRLRFYLAARERTRLDSGAKKEIKRIISFFEGRE